MNVPTGIGKVIRLARVAKGFSQTEVCRRLNLNDHVRVSQWELSKLPVPMEYRKPLADLLGIDVAALGAPPLAPPVHQPPLVATLLVPRRSRNGEAGTTTRSFSVGVAEIETWDAFCTAHRITRSEFLSRAAALLLKAHGS